MKTGTKVWLIAAALLIVIGGMLFAGVMSHMAWDFTKLSTVSYENHCYEIAETFDSLAIQTDTEDVVLRLSEDGKCRVECYEKEDGKHSVTVEDGKLKVQRVRDESGRSWIGWIGFDFGSPGITVYLPEREYASLFIQGSTGDIQVPGDFRFGDAEVYVNTGSVEFYAAALEEIQIRTDTGDIRVEGVSAESVDLSVTTGRITADGIQCSGNLSAAVTTGDALLREAVCRNLTSNGSTGDITLERVRGKEAFTIHRSTGDVRFEQSDAPDIFVETGTGHVTGTLLTGKVFVTQSDTGRISVPGTSEGGICEVRTGTGDIELVISTQE